MKNLLIILFMFFSFSCFADTVINGASLNGTKTLGEGKIVFITLGDSITYGIGSPDSWGYRKKLQDLIAFENKEFKEAYRNPNTAEYGYYHRTDGVSGNTTAQMETRLSTILSSYCTDADVNHYVLLIHAGTNDDRSTEENRQLAVDNVEDMLDLIKAYEIANSVTIDTYVALIIPQNVGGSTIADYNTQLNTMLSSYDKLNLYVVDMYTEFTNNASWATEYMDDLTHPNDAGYQVMANTWATAIQANE